MARRRRKKRETCWPFTVISASKPSPKTDRFLLFLSVLWNAIVKLLNSENLEKDVAQRLFSFQQGTSPF
jgi:hypothetical protein